MCDAAWASNGARRCAVGLSHWPPPWPSATPAARADPSGNYTEPTRGRPHWTSVRARASGDGLAAATLYRRGRRAAANGARPLVTHRCAHSERTSRPPEQAGDARGVSGHHQLHRPRSEAFADLRRVRQASADILALSRAHVVYLLPCGTYAAFTPRACAPMFGLRARSGGASPATPLARPSPAAV